MRVREFFLCPLSLNSARTIFTETSQSFQIIQMLRNDKMIPKTQIKFTIKPSTNRLPVIQ